MSSEPNTATPRFAILDAPSGLGLRSPGVTQLPAALRAAGLVTQLNAADTGRVEQYLPYDSTPDPDTRLLNGTAIQDYSRRLADALAPLLGSGQFPVVLGGDCSVLLGAMLALRRRQEKDGAYGLFFLDGHTDFYQPEAEPNGEVASMELAFVSGRGPSVLADIDGLGPLVRDENIVAFGSRDQEEAKQEGSQDIRAVSMICVCSLAEARQQGVVPAAQAALNHLLRKDLSGFWIHVDADVLDDAVMPAVDYRLPGGLSFKELSAVLRVLIASGKAVGMTVAIFNPSLDTAGLLAYAFTRSLVAGLT